MKSIIKTIELNHSPEQVFARIQKQKPCFWLDSAIEHPERGIWSYLGFNPFLKIRFHNSILQVSGIREEELKTRNPLKELRNYFLEWKMPQIDPRFPFLSGGVGYLGYEMGNYIERLPFTRKDDLLLPEMALNFYQFILGFHHPESRWYLLGFEDSKLGKSAEEFEYALGEIMDADEGEFAGEFFSEKLESNLSRQEYINAVLRAKEYIRSGDIYQVNFTQRFSSAYGGSAFALYQRLRRQNPGCYAGVWLEPEFSILSSSPELFLRVRGNDVLTRPIKGTRPRGKTSEDDEKQRTELLNSEKDLAELAMIVDLERNDLGRVCDYGSVKVLGYPELESYSRVHHLIATVSGKLAQGKDIFDLLRATFPGGSITGAPKIRAMEIIDELEPNTRGPYTGSLGWISFSGNMELNIAIRIIILKNRFAYFPAGGGIVYDSDPDSEYEESWTKALALWEALSGREPNALLTNEVDRA